MLEGRRVVEITIVRYRFPHPWITTGCVAEID